MNLLFDATNYNAVTNTIHPITNVMDINEPNINPISSTCSPTHHHDQMTEMVRHQLCRQQYAKIDLQQQSVLEKQSRHLISCFTSSCLRNSDAQRNARMVPDDIIHLLCSFYPLFYWNPHYISLQSRSHIFIVHNECCKLSKLLENPETLTQTCTPESTSDSPLVITKDIASDSLELLIKYLVHMHCMESTNDPITSVGLAWICKRLLSHKRLLDLHATAKKMKCESLVELACDQIVQLTGKSPQEIDPERTTQANAGKHIEQIWDSHFTSLQLRFGVRLHVSSRDMSN
eukprot:429580_1